MKIDKIIETFHLYENFNIKFKEIYNEFATIYAEDEIEKIINLDLSITNKNLDLIKAIDFLFEINCFEKHYFDVDYNYFADIFNNSKNNYLEIKSNYINLTMILDNIKKLENVFTLKTSNTQVVILNTTLNESSFSYTEIEIAFNNSYILKQYKDQSIKIYGSENNIELFYDFILQYLRAICIYDEKLRIYKCILGGLYFATDILKSKSITHLIYDKNILNKKIYLHTIDDLYNANLFDFDIFELDYIYTKLRVLDFNTPSYYYNLIITNLTPKEKAVFQLRFNEKQTLEQVGQKFNLTRERARQIETRGIERFVNNKKFNKFCNSIILHCGNAFYFTEEDLLENNLDVSFIRKVYPQILGNCFNEKFYFYDSKCPLILEKYIETLPDMSLTDELANNIKLFFEEQFKGLNSGEIQDWILNNYHHYSKYSFRNKLKHNKVVILIMKKYFSDGIDLNDEESILSIIKYAKDEYDYELTDSIRSIKAIIQNTCIPCGRGRRIYNEQSIILSENLSEKILNFICKYKSDAVPISGIYDIFEDDLNEIGIMNRYSLQDVLKRSFSDKYNKIITRDYVLESESSSIYDEIELYISNSSHLVTIEELKENFPGITNGILQSVTDKTNILNMNGYYVNIQSFNITTDEKKTLFDLINEKTNNGVQQHSKFLFDSIKQKISGFFNRIGLNHYLQFYSLVEKLFKSNFNFQRPFIGNKKVNIITCEELLLNNVIKKGEVTLKEFKELSHTVGYYLDGYIEYVKKYVCQIIFKNQHTIISVEKIDLKNFDEDKLDLILHRFIGELDYKALYLFTSYWELPDIGIKWNEWVLYSIILKYSKQFDVVTTSKIMKNAIPVIIKKGFKLSESIIHEIESRKIENNELDDVLDFDELDINEF